MSRLRSAQRHFAAEPSSSSLWPRPFLAFARCPTERQSGSAGVQASSLSLRSAVRVSLRASLTTTPPGSRPTRSWGPTTATACCGCCRSRRWRSSSSTSSARALGVVTGRGPHRLIRDRYGAARGDDGCGCPRARERRHDCCASSRASQRVSSLAASAATSACRSPRSACRRSSLAAASGESSTCCSRSRRLRRVHRLRLARASGLGCGRARARRPVAAARPARLAGCRRDVGTTLAPWGLAFIQSYAVDKRLGPKDLRYERIDVVGGALLTGVIGFFVVVACAATLHAQGRRSTTRATRRVALRAARRQLRLDAVRASASSARRCSRRPSSRSPPPTRSAEASGARVDVEGQPPRRARLLRHVLRGDGGRCGHRVDTGRAARADPFPHAGGECRPSAAPPHPDDRARAGPLTHG